MIAAIAMPTVGAIAGYVLCFFVAGLAIAILWLIFDGSIDLSRLISEPTGDASMARFQFLVFTFVIALSLFLVVASGKDGDGKPAFPESIPGGILTLLGISGSSYAVGKAIQFSDPAGVEERPVTVTIVPDTANVCYGKTFQFTTEVIRQPDAKLRWEVSLGRGSIDDTGLYTAPKEPQPPPPPAPAPAATATAAAPAPPAPPPDTREHATIKVSLVDFPDVTDLAVVTLIKMG